VGGGGRGSLLSQGMVGEWRGAPICQDTSWSWCWIERWDVDEREKDGIVSYAWKWTPGGRNTTPTSMNLDVGNGIPHATNREIIHGSVWGHPESKHT